MSPVSRTLLVISSLGFAALSGCAESRLHAADDYGVAVSENIAAQIADPDARYTGDPAPASDGHRAALAQSRYERNAVIKPAATSTSTAVSNAGTGGGGGGPAPAP
jgi:hypothetical protein